MSEKEETSKFIKLVYFLDKYNNFYDNFLESYGEYMLSDHFISFGKGLQHLELYNLYQNFLDLKILKESLDPTNI